MVTLTGSTVTSASLKHSTDSQGREDMNTEPSVKLIKKEDRNGPATPVEPDASADPKEWSTAVKSWVKEFQKDRRDESLEAFENLFGDSTP